MRSINALTKLSELSGKLTDRMAGRVTKGKKPTVESVEKQVSLILSGQHMKDLIETTVKEHNNILSLTYSLNDKVYGELSDTYLGKNIIVSLDRPNDKSSWTVLFLVITISCLDYEKSPGSRNFYLHE